jgi:hypothetical protein
LKTLSKDSVAGVVDANELVDRYLII